jgi:hypothetical protein
MHNISGAYKVKDLITLRHGFEKYMPWTRLNNRFFLDFIFYALNVKKVVFLQQINGFSSDYNVKLFFGQMYRFSKLSFIKLKESFRMKKKWKLLSFSDLNPSKFHYLISCGRMLSSNPNKI